MSPVIKSKNWFSMLQCHIKSVNNVSPRKSHLKFIDEEK